jgi:protein TonB
MQVPDFDDIVFEGLNKEYGAYLLRKRYNHVVSISILMAGLLGCLVVIIPYYRFPAREGKQIHTVRFVTVENLISPAETSDSPIGPTSSDYPKAMSSARKIISVVNNAAPVVVDSILPVKNEMAVISDSLADGQQNEGISNGKGILAGGGGEGGTGGGGTGGTGTYSNVDIMPTFRNGDINKFREWVQKKTKYPMSATANSIQGKVYITFVIDRDGSVINVKVVRGVDPLIDEEALEAVRSSPKWTPGKYRGEAVRVSYMILVNFEL